VVSGPRAANLAAATHIMSRGARASGHIPPTLALGLLGSSPRKGAQAPLVGSPVCCLSVFEARLR
jgi:hypothetical protein